MEPWSTRYTVSSRPNTTSRPLLGPASTGARRASGTDAAAVSSTSGISNNGSHREGGRVDRGGRVSAGTHGLDTSNSITPPACPMRASQIGVVIWYWHLFLVPSSHEGGSTSDRHTDTITATPPEWRGSASLAMTVVAGTVPTPHPNAETRFPCTRVM